MTAPLYVLEHQTCGHFAGAANDREGLDAQQRILAAGGYHRWHVRAAATDEVDSVITAILTDERCPTCHVDVTRAHLPGVADVAAQAEADAGPRIVVVPGRPDADDDEVAIMPGACCNTPEQVATMRQQTHDGLLDVVRGRRHGPVQWREWHGREACTTTLRALYADDPRPVKAFGLDQFEAFFTEYPADCVLVVASVKVLP